MSKLFLMKGYEWPTTGIRQKDGTVTEGGGV